MSKKSSKVTPIIETALSLDTVEAVVTDVIIEEVTPVVETPVVEFVESTIGQLYNLVKEEGHALVELSGKQVSVTDIAADKAQSYYLKTELGKSAIVTGGYLIKVDGEFVSVDKAKPGMVVDTVDGRDKLLFVRKYTVVQVIKPILSESVTITAAIDGITYTDYTSVIVEEKVKVGK